MTEEDLIQEVAIRYMETETTQSITNFCHNTLRRVLRKLHKKTKVERLGSDAIETIPSTEDHPLSVSNEVSLETMLLYGIVSAELDDIDVDVLLDNLSRAEAAERLGMSYGAYRKRLNRKINKLKRNYDFLLTKNF